MGRPKLLLPLGGELVIDCVLRAWCDSPVEHMVVVCRASDDELRRACEKWPVVVTSPSSDPVDMKASLVHGLGWLQDNASPTSDDYWMAAPADLPKLSSQVIRRVATEPFDKKVVVPRFANHASHPIRLPWALADELRELRPDDGLKTIVERNDVHYVDFSANEYAADIDTPDDYRQLSKTELIGQIEFAFRGVELGDGISLNMAYFIDSCGTDTRYAELAKSDERHDWRSIPDEVIENFIEVFSFTDLPGYQFYLPRYMIWTVENHQSSSNPISDFTIYALDPEKHQFTSTRFVDWFSADS